MPGKLVFEIQHTLKAPFEYALDGSMVKASYLVINAPNNKVIHCTSILEQVFSDALFSIKKNFADDIESAKGSDRPVEEESEESTRSSILMMLSQAKDYSKCFIALKEILTFEHGSKAMCYIDGLTKMTKPLFDEMSIVDTREVLAAYIQNFLNTSL